MNSCKRIGSGKNKTSTIRSGSGKGERAQLRAGAVKVERAQLRAGVKITGQRKSAAGRIAIFTAFLFIEFSHLRAIIIIRTYV